MTDRTLAETETHLNMCAEDRSRWEMSTDDNVMIARMKKFGIVPHRVNVSGVHFYQLTSDNVVIRARKRKVSDVQRRASAERLEAARKGKHTAIDGSAPNV